MEVRFISDLHFGHKNILRYDNRPFDSVEEMDEAMTSLWNDTVGEYDVTYILGDISWLSPKKTADAIAQLNGKKVLVRGNHDTDSLLSECGSIFEEIVDYKEITGYGKRTPIVMSHYPIVFFNRAHYGAVHFYGHVHNSWQWDAAEGMRIAVEKRMEMKWNMVNVGCMLSYVNYIPRTFDEIMEGYEKWANSK